jgi:tetratricopeptide (TPR) repeat protein
VTSPYSLALSLGLSLSLALGPTVALAAPPPSEPPPDTTTDTGVSEADKTEAEQLSARAIEEFNAKNYDKAVELFKQAYEVDPQPNYLFNIGRVYEEAGNLESAVDFYGQFVKQPGVDIDAREVALERLRVLRAILEETKQPDPKDDPEPDPEPEVEPQPDPEPVPDPSLEKDKRKRKVMRGAGFGLLGVGAGVLIGGAVLGALAQGDNRKADEAASLAERRDLLGSSQGKALGADVMFGIGGALLVTGVVLVALGFSKPKSGSKVAFAPSFGPRGGAMTMQMRF